MEDVLISIIIATYNPGYKLNTTLKSLRKQHYKNFELIIIDGGSDDLTVDVIRENEDFISYWVSEQDNGVYDAWNKGINVATGKWICFLGAGDTLYPDTLLKYTNVINTSSSHLDFISGKVQNVTIDGIEATVFGQKWKWREFRNIMTLAHVGALHNRKLFEDVGLFDTDYLIAGDYELLLRKRGELKTFFIPEVLANMELGGISFSIKALKESSIAQRKTAGNNPIKVFLYYLYRLLLFKTYYLRNFKYNSIRSSFTTSN
ncbi:MAG: glycosyltransferase family 2 protein [Bacteroidales bacterium]